ncbi:MAG TPA: helix-turn-helix domain-containing protein [Xanthobacteraceae bacterium]
MPGNALSIVTNILEKALLGGPDAEIAEMIEMVRRESPSSPISQDVERLHLHLKTVTQAIRDRGVSERGLGLLIDTTHDLSGTLALQDLLQTIVSRARSLVGANVAYLTMLDDDHRILRTVTAEGHIHPATSEMKTRVGYGAVSLAINSKTFFDTQDYLHDRRFRHSEALDRVFKAEGIVSLAGFPILSEDKLQGVLFVADRYRRKLSEREISILGSFALYAGVAMRNAHAFTRLSDALAEAERNRTALVDHIHRVDVSAAAHDEMTSLLAKGTEWPLFIQRMADQIDGAIVLCDDSLAVKGQFTSASFGGRLVDLHDGKVTAPKLGGAISHSRRSGRSVVLDAGIGNFRVMALPGGTERGESLVICHRGELDPIDIRNLERSTVALSIAKLWSEKRETDQLIASSTLLRHLILVDPPDSSTVRAIRDRLKTKADQPLTLAVIAMTGLDRAAQTTTIRAAAANMNLLVDLIGDAYLAAGSEKSIQAFLQTLMRRRKGWDIGGIVSDSFADLTQAAVHYGQIESALRVLRKMKRLTRFVEYSQVNLFAKLFEAGDASRVVRYLERILLPIEQRDRRQKTELKKTLLCYLDNKHSIARTAHLLGVHINTVRQRLGTLREITGGWDDPVSALELHVALRLDAITSTA